jgi:glycosyltransferase involved in cell wall biosynthesis
MRVLVLARYGQQGASSRVRSFQYLSTLAASGIKCEVSPLVDDLILLKKYRLGGYLPLDVLFAYARRIVAMFERGRFDLVWIEKESLPWFPVWLERLFLHGRPYVLDLDDAIFHNYDLHRVAAVRRLYGQRIDRLMAGARLVLAGNRYLADRAEAAGAPRVEVIPSVVDLAAYPLKANYGVTRRPVIVWIGSPSTVQYLLELAKPLRLLAGRRAFTLRVIGGGTITMQGVDVEAIPWSVETEAAAIGECDVGIMPLRDTPWEQGKCAYKLIQYMACGLPTVASPVGANRDVLVEGVTGFFARTHSDWAELVDLVLSDPSLRERLGKAGRARVEANYSLQQVAPKLVSLLTQAGGHLQATSSPFHSGGPR